MGGTLLSMRITFKEILTVSAFLLEAERPHVNPYFSSIVSRRKNEVYQH